MRSNCSNLNLVHRTVICVVHKTFFFYYYEYIFCYIIFIFFSSQTPPTVAPCVPVNINNVPTKEPQSLRENHQPIYPVEEKVPVICRVPDHSEKSNYKMYDIMLTLNFGNYDDF